MTRRVTWLLVITAAAMLTFGLGWTVSAADAQHLEGSWVLSATVAVPGFPPAEFINLATLTREGSVVGSSPFPDLSTAHGAWVRTGNREFTVTAFYLRSDAAGNFVGKTRMRVRLTLDPSGNEASGFFIQEGFDLAGNVVRSIQGPAQAKRISVEPLP